MKSPPVSVVIPVKRSQRTIRAAVEALLAQDYDGPLEVILVGDPGDPTWRALDGLEGRVRRIERDVRTGGRDANVKRNAGLAQASGEILCLTDSDMVPARDWISTGVRLLGGPIRCAGGPMASVARDFWGTYVDENPLASKTPRMPEPYLVTRASMARRGHKLPITANVFFTGEVYEAVGGLDEGFIHSYEDYEWFQRVVEAGFPIYCTPELVAHHYHRQGWRELVREYRRSGRGCAQFVRKHPRSRWTRKRLADLTLVLGALVLAVLAATGAALGLVAPALVAGGLGMCAVLAGILALGTSVRARSAAAALFPAVTFVLGLAFSVGMLRGLLGRSNA